MSAYRYVGNVDPNDGTGRIIVSRSDDGDVVLEVGGPAVEVSEEQVKELSVRYKLVPEGEDYVEKPVGVPADYDEYDVDEAQIFLEDASPQVVEAVKAYEAENKGRVGVLEFEPEVQSSEGVSDESNQEDDGLDVDLDPNLDH